MTGTASAAEVFTQSALPYTSRAVIASGIVNPPRLAVKTSFTLRRMARAAGPSSSMRELATSRLEAVCSHGLVDRAKLRHRCASRASCAAECDPSYSLEHTGHTQSRWLS